MRYDLVQTLRAVHEQVQLAVIHLALPLALDEVNEDVVEGVELVVGEGVDPAADDAGELDLIGRVAVDELQDVEDWYVLDQVLLVLPAGRGENGDYAEQVADRDLVEAGPVALHQLECQSSNQPVGLGCEPFQQAFDHKHHAGLYS